MEEGEIEEVREDKERGSRTEGRGRRPGGGNSSLRRSFLHSAPLKAEH